MFRSLWLGSGVLKASVSEQPATVMEQEAAAYLYEGSTFTQHHLQI